MRRARRCIGFLIELSRLLQEGTEQLVVILATTKRIVFELTELVLFLYALWLILGRH